MRSPVTLAPATLAPATPASVTLAPATLAPATLDDPRPSSRTAPQPDGAETEIGLGRCDEAAAIAVLADTFHREDGHSLSRAGAAALIAMLDPGRDLGRVVVLRVGGAVAGYGALCFGYSVEYEGREAFIDDIYVAPDHRGRDHGQRLLVRLQQEARDAGCHAIHMEVMAGNPAEHWYRAQGWTDRGSLLLTKRMV